MGVKSYIAVNLCHPVFEPFNLLQTPADSVSMKSAISAAVYVKGKVQERVMHFEHFGSFTL